MAEMSTSKLMQISRHSDKSAESTMATACRQNDSGPAAKLNIFR
jgi:hypothetical protein